MAHTPVVGANTANPLVHQPSMDVVAMQEAVANRQQVKLLPYPHHHSDGSECCISNQKESST